MTNQITPPTGQAPASEPVFTIKGVKAFNPDLSCRDFQFKEGGTFHHGGYVEACESGFHFCENPIDTFQYYEPSKSIFHHVDGGGDIDRHDNGSKVACSDIKIGAKISLHNLIGASIEFMFARKYQHQNKRNKNSSANSSTGYRSANSSTGYSSAAVATGLNSSCMAGRYGCIALQWWNHKKKRCEMKCAEVGCGDGSDGKLKAKTWYELNEAGEFVEAENE